MSGYAPLYPSMFEGSLRGKPEQLLVWTWVIAHKNMFGVIDQHPRCCADATGLPLDVVCRVLAEFCAPDAESRSQEHEGRRLVPIEGRGFGWRVVNHELYRDRARKKSYDEERTASGKDAERKRAERAAHKVQSSRPVPTCPDASRQSLPSETESDPETESESKTRSSDPVVSVGGAGEGTPRNARRTPAGWKRLPQDWKLSPELITWAGENAPDVDLARELEAIRDYEFSKVHTDADATVRTWLRTEQKKIEAARRRTGQPQRETNFQRMRRVVREVAD